MKTELREALIKAQQEYITFLGEEVSRLTMPSHPWTLPSQETLDKGEGLRKEIIELEIKLL